MFDAQWQSYLASLPWASLGLAWLLAWAAVRLLIPWGQKWEWIDRPSGRKRHRGEVPLVGGWGVLIAVVTVQLLAPEGHRAPIGYWCGALLLFSVALVDDRRPVRARYRLMVQIAAAVAAVGMGGSVLPDLGDLLGTGSVNAWWIVVPVSLLGVVSLVNAFNFTDGADGLCGGLTFIALFWLLASLMRAELLSGPARDSVESYASAMVPLGLAVMGGLLGFLLFNLRTPWRGSAVVFLGDSGSMLLGFTVAWFAIHATSAYGATSLDPVACLWIVAVPLADAAACIVRRLRSKVTPTTADLKHLHHLLERNGLTVSESVTAIHAGSFVCGLIGFAGWQAQVPESVMFAAFVSALFAFVTITIRAWERLEPRQTYLQRT